MAAIKVRMTARQMVAAKEQTFQKNADKATSLYSPSTLDRQDSNTLRNHRIARAAMDARARKQHTLHNPLVMKIGYEKDGARYVEFACVCVVQFANMKQPGDRKCYYCKDHRETDELRQLIDTAAVRAIR